MTIDATSNINFGDVAYWYDETNPLISDTQLINATQWDIISEVELMVCNHGDLFESYVLQTSFDATILDAINYMKQTEGYFTIYEVDCNDPSPTITGASQCNLGKLDVYNVTDGTSDYLQVEFRSESSCDCIGCDESQLFCRDVDVGGYETHQTECQICNEQQAPRISGACPDRVISDLTECDTVSGTISAPYESHSYDYAVNSTVTFSTCGSEINTKLRIIYDWSDDEQWADILQHPEEDPSGWLDTNACGMGDSGEQYVVDPTDIHNATLIRIQIRGFGEDTGNYNLAAICEESVVSNTTETPAPPTTTETPLPPGFIEMNQTLRCGDSVQETLLEALDAQNGIETHSYELEINPNNHMSVFFSTCGSEMETSLRLSDSPTWTDRRSTTGNCDDAEDRNEEYFATWASDITADIMASMDVTASDPGDYVLDVICQEKDVSTEIECGDKIDAYTDGSIDRYTFDVNSTDYMGVYWTSCGSEIETHLRVTDMNEDPMFVMDDLPCESGDAFILNDASMDNWRDVLDGSTVNIDVISWSSGNYTLHVSCQDYSTIEDITCGDVIVGNTFESYGANFKFVNPVDQPVMFDICSVSNVVELTFYDSDWSNGETQMFAWDDGGDWRNNRSDCAHWVSTDENGTEAGQYFLRVERPVMFLLEVVCDEEYVYPDPRTSDVMGDECNYIQAYPDDEIWPIDECFAFAQPSEDYTYSMHWVCDYDTDGNVTVAQHWYNQTSECDANDTEPMHSSFLDPSEIFSFTCEAVDACSYVNIRQFDDCNPHRDDPMDCVANNGYEAGGYVIDECFVVETPGGFGSVKRLCSEVSQSMIEMYHVGFDCTREYNYANVTHDLAGFVGNRYWVFDSCPTAQPTTTGDTTAETTGDTDTTAETTESTAVSITETTVESTAVIVTTSDASHTTEEGQDDSSCQNVPFVFVVCVLCAFLY
eukprot:300035_1